MSKKKQSTTLKGKIWSTLKILLLAALFYLGVTLIFFGSGFGGSYLVEQNAEQASADLTSKKVEQNKKRKTTYDASKTKSISTARIIRSRGIKAYAIGRISIPAVNIHNPLFAGYGDQNQNLEYGVVTCLPDRTMGGENNYVLAGHYMGTYGPAVLDNLHLAKKGDVVYVTDLHNIYAYEINNISFAVKPTQVEVENNVQGKSMITLITCSDFNTSKYGYGQHRTVVQGDLIKKQKATEKNLQAAELASSKKKNQTKKQSISSTEKKTSVKQKQVIQTRVRPHFFQNMKIIKGMIICFNLLFFLFMSWRVIVVWLPNKK